MKSSELPVPSESAEQQRLFQWARMAQGRYPELRWLYHVPNEGQADADRRCTPCGGGAEKRRARPVPAGSKAGMPRAVHRA